MGRMDSLPLELFDLILLWNVRICKFEKNLVLPLRQVCKAFNVALRPYTFKTIQLEFSRFLRDARTTPDIEALQAVGPLCSAVYLDMMVVRDEEEITRLSDVFHGLIPKVPEMLPLLDSLRQYCMTENTFDESDFRRVMEGVLQATPNMTRLKVNLPFQVVGRASLTATLLLATTFACIANRPEEYSHVETLVLDHVSDTTIISICNNPIDLGNALSTFSGLTNIVLSIKRQEARATPQSLFARNLWFLIHKALDLESLCVTGWNIKRNSDRRKHRHYVSHNDWVMRSLPYPEELDIGFPKLRYLELKRVDIFPHLLMKMIGDCADSLKELYLNEVYIKVSSITDGANTALWIGHPDITRPEECLWVADEIRQLREGPLRLDILRVTGLGYDDYNHDEDSARPNYDLDDPTGLSRPFDERFVEAVFGIDDEMSIDPPSYKSPSLQTPSSLIDIASQYVPPVVDQLTHATPSVPRILPPHPKARLRQACQYDAETYQKYHNTTSQYKRCIDGYFFNHNEQALKELQRIIKVADRGMVLISQELERSQRVRVNALDGTLEVPPEADVATP